MRMIIYWSPALAHCGDHITHLLNSLPSKPECILLGSNSGLAIQLQSWTDENDVTVEYYSPQYNVHGDMAVPMRNQQMIESADIVLVVWDGRDASCRGMIAMAEDFGVKCLQFNPYSEKKVDKRPEKKLVRKITGKELEELKATVDAADPAKPFQMSTELVFMLLDAISRRDYVIKKFNEQNNRPVRK